eukprot:756709-Hanusia_phi.AAC.1
MERSSRGVEGRVYHNIFWDGPGVARNILERLLEGLTEGGNLRGRGTICLYQLIRIAGRRADLLVGELEANLPERDAPLLLL